MISSVSQLILDFESTVGSRDQKGVILRMFRSEREYFDAKKLPVPEFEVELPHAFHETAFMDPGGWRQRPRPAGPAQDLGHRMWLNLPQTVRDAVLSGSSDQPQRVAILSTASGVDDIPWEWLNDGDERLIGAMDSVRFLRLVPTLYVSPPLTVAPPIRVLIVVTNPKDERLLQSDIEINIITQGLKDNTKYEVRTLLAPRIEALREALEWSPHIIHYVGHSGISGTTGNLILHDEQDGTRWLPASEVARYLPSSVRLLCLSTCVTAKNYQTGGLAKFAHCPAEIMLPTTIVNQYALGKTGAKSFWREFYPALLDKDGDVVEAFHKARTTTLAEDTDSWWCWASFSLVVRDGVGHPFHITQSAEQPQDRFAAEIQAQWSARLANNLAVRMRSLDTGVQKHWEKTLADEGARIESFERDIEKL